MARESDEPERALAWLRQAWHRRSGWKIYRIRRGDEREFVQTVLDLHDELATIAGAPSSPGTRRAPST